MKTKSLIRACNAIALMTMLLVLLQYMDLYTLGYELGKNYTNTLMWQVVIQGIEAMGIISCCILFLKLAYNAKRGIIFEQINEKLLMVSGIVIVCIGSISNASIHIITIKALSTSTCDLLILIGFSFIFFSLVFKIGRKLKEEQELTI